MRGFIVFPFWFLVLIAADPLDAKTVSVTDGGVAMQITDLPVQERCVVTLSSGSYLLDHQACARALADVPAQFGGLPEGSYLFPGRDRRYADGSCVLADGSPVPADLASTCASLLKQMGKARVTMAAKREDWVRPADLPGSADATLGSISVSIGVSPAGTARFCVPIRSSGNAVVDKAVCDAVLKRAQFEPALDAGGPARPVHGRAAIPYPGKPLTLGQRRRG
jgi:hypothetical protein